ncbi:Phosphate-binding protein (fragment) [Hyella patelloides LEGE 07179]|uniref:Phosphate-binding protein n=1 Tax=Hyella patelloides LEGE 07179 TaxID=945734 RepID=A0A563VQC4_9CYAN
MFLAFKKTKILQLLFLFSLVFLVSFACDRQTIKTKLTPITIIGKGGSASLLHTWLFEHKKIYPHINIEYEVIGSTAGIKEFKQETVDFAISDRQITEAEIKEVNNGVVFLPITADAISVVYNLPEIKHNLRLSREVLANIFLGKITNWNDPQIQKINSSIKLPNKKIALVYRADGSMTNWIFTKYLSAISKEWQHKIGTTKNIQLSFGIGAKGRGFIDTLAKTENSIGFLNYSYAKNINMPMASLENQAGNYITPTKKILFKL